MNELPLVIDYADKVVCIPTILWNRLLARSSTVRLFRTRSSCFTPPPMRTTRTIWPSFLRFQKNSWVRRIALRQRSRRVSACCIILVFMRRCNTALSSTYLLCKVTNRITRWMEGFPSSISMKETWSLRTCMLLWIKLCVRMLRWSGSLCPNCWILLRSGSVIR